MKFVGSSSRLLRTAWAAAVLTTALSSCGPPVQMHPAKPVAPANQPAAEKRELRKALSLPPEHAANSIDTLSPDDHFVLVTKDLPIAGGVPYHSVMGNRGKSVPKEQSSDGVVAYWSSHVDGARSERLVPSGHSSHAHPEGIEELHRILLLHLESQ